MEKTLNEVLGQIAAILKTLFVEGVIHRNNVLVRLETIIMSFFIIIISIRIIIHCHNVLVGLETIIMSTFIIIIIIRIITRIIIHYHDVLIIVMIIIIMIIMIKLIITIMTFIITMNHDKCHHDPPADECHREREKVLEFFHHCFIS